MKLYDLPANLSNLSDKALIALNLELRVGQVKLNWSRVLTAPVATLELLLAGLSLNEDGESLGIETVPDELAGSILRVASKPTLRRLDPTTTTSRPAPTVWQAEAQAEDEEVLVEPAPAPAFVVTTASKKELVAEPGTSSETRSEADQEAPAIVGKLKPNPEPLLKAPTPAAIRAELEELVFKELHGPVGGPDEELATHESPRDRYLVGLLAPGSLQSTPDTDQGGHLDPDEQDDLSSAESTRTGEDGTGDAVSQQLISMTPSSIGLSFSVIDSADQLKLTARWGHYQRAQSEHETTETGKPRQVWKRTPREASLVITLKEGKLKEWQPALADQPEVVVRGLVRRPVGCREWSITLFLVNNQQEPEHRRDTAWLFQPSLVIEAPDNQPVFQQRLPQRPDNGNQLENTADRQEARSMKMLYRKQISFAIGHGVSVHADTLPDDSTRAYRLSTRIVPAYEVPRTDHVRPDDEPALAGLSLEMDELARTPAAELPDLLGPLLTAYAGWIDRQEARLADSAEGLAEHQPAARQALDNCRRTLVRIRAGLDLLTTDKQAARAFAFMNAAMHRQFMRSAQAQAWRQGRKPGTTGSLGQSPRWRPFQIAFILLNLPSLTDPHHPDRAAQPDATADLLWFPTGGGKTEAYLGLTAFTLAIRRLQGPLEGRGEEGVAVLMRYTLRLLTLQQFQRATALICACETLRRETLAQGDLSWGATPFRLGLWVGQRSTPNTTEQSEESLKQEGNRRGSVVGGSGTPRQLENCPWCGHEVRVIVESFNKGQGRTLLYCTDPLGGCAFTEKNAPGEGLPVLVVDEEIYRRLPALLIATVDKFAQLPWRGATQMLFGQVDRKCDRHGFGSPDLPDAKFHPARQGMVAVTVREHGPLRPPDLIIQDELHLISGPLGTLVGLYEAVVDHLCSWELDGQLVRPKVIAATATIRRAERQINALFMRQVDIFPPSGLDIGDNFFARQIAATQNNPGRRYIGICASGRRLKAALIRVYVAFLAASQKLYEKYGAAADPWLTLVGYFNSLNELGGTRRLVEDDVRTRLLKMDERGLAARKLQSLDELTSRRSSVDIPRLLSQLERRFEPKAQTGKADETRPLDVMLATNMISVGVDVQRLGLMVVTGQPKNTAEYIQATSRVGRNHPGLVCVVYNWARPRDLSHYEQFEHYHATYYQYVEALSVTPFAARALDRGLSALLVSYIRLSDTGMNANNTAGAFKTSNLYFKMATEQLSQRAALIKDGLAGQDVQTRLSELGNRWVEAASVKGRTLVYKPESGAFVQLLEQPGRGEWHPFTCLNSLRDVEATVKLIFDERSLSDKNVQTGSNLNSSPTQDSEVPSSSL